MPVTNEHELYSEFKDDWEEVRDCVKGNRAIKKKREKYLPMLSGQKPADYDRYLKKVKFFGATSRTLDGLHGNIFRKAPEYTGKVSETFEQSLKDVDLMGTSLEQFVSNIVNDDLQTNWGGVLVDYARGQEVLSLKDAEDKGLKWYLQYYPAEKVINWAYETIKGKKKLCWVVLVEPYTEPDPNNRFITKKYNRYRELYLDKVTKKYRQNVFDDKVGLTEPTENEIIIKMNGEEMDEIPFYTLPDKEPEKSMLYDLAQLNLQHYVDTADYNHGKHYTSIPTPIAIGLKPEMDETVSPPVAKPMFIGGTQFQFFPNEEHVPGADVKFLEFTGSGMKALSDGITHLESQMAILGAHIIAAEKKGVETAEALRIHRIGENGVLASFTRNISSQITLAMRKKGEGDKEDIKKLNEWSVNFNTDYDVSDENIQALVALLAGRTTGEIPKISIFMMLKGMNLIPEQWSFDDYIAEIDKDAQEKLPELKKTLTEPTKESDEDVPLDPDKEDT
jgi:hypothetical protein